MSFRPIVPEDSPSTSSRAPVPAGDAAETGGTRAHDELVKVAQMLAAHGGGAVSLDLALDLVLNQVVEQARKATGATGAAIALARDGEMVCRATAGPNAPDLGVRVETESGLTGACLKSGEVQQCADTEADARVDAEACRRLGVRSMLIFPISEGQRPFGILEVLSSRPHGFGEREIDALKPLARKIAVNKRGAEEGAIANAAKRVDVGPERLKELESLEISPETMAQEEIVDVNGKNVWTSVLVVLVIAAAVALGIVIGWSGAVRGRSASRTRTVVPITAGANQNTAAAEQRASAPGDPTRSAKSASAPQLKAIESVLQEPPNDDLVVTQNGKVIYRGSPSDGTASDEEVSTSRLIHRVEPEYPEAARAQQLQGTVVLEVQIRGDGTVGNVATITGDKVLAEAAVAAVKQWKYRPYSGSGQQIASQTRITIKFTLPST
jgi:TonB family protein